MGLFKRRQSALQQVVAGTASWRIALVVAGLCILIALFGDEGRAALRYDRFAISSGEYWRVLTGHFAHLGQTHLLLNLAGLVLVWLLVGRYFTDREWAIVVALTTAVTSFLFWYVDVNLLWYVGLSGILHGFLVAGAIRGFRSQPTESAIICAIVAGKLIYEQVVGPLPGSESVSGGEVVVNAHLNGAIAGAIAAFVLWRSAGDSRSI